MIGDVPLIKREIVIHSDALLPATLSMVQDEINFGRSMLRDAEPLPIPTRPCHVYRRGRMALPAALTFMEILREADAELTAIARKGIERPSKKKRRS